MTRGKRGESAERRRGKEWRRDRGEYSCRTLDPGSDDEETFGGGRVNIPPMKQKLVGHRNARTMIKVGIPCLNL